MVEFKKEWIGHVAFWVGYLLVKLFIVEYFREDFFTVFLVELISLPLKMILVYVLVFFLIPTYLLKKSYFKFTLWLIGLFLFAAFARRVTDVYLAYPISMLYFDEAVFWDFGTAFRNLVFVYPVVGLGTAIYLMSHWINDYQMRTQLQKEKLEAELKYLKAQVHPHFLFNTINNIYSLSLDQSPKTSKALLDLSDLLSYMLYDCNVERISLDKEIELIENYSSLERLRYNDRLDVQFVTKGNLSEVKIAPLILLPFVDNCFKHGAGDSMAECYVHFYLAVENEKLELVLKNSIDESNKVSEGKSGIGLTNARKRLEGEYPNAHELLIQARNDEFEVRLNICLDEKA